MLRQSVVVSVAGQADYQSSPSHHHQTQQEMQNPRRAEAMMDMKILELWVYPIKALRGIPLEAAHLGHQGLVHDRRFMLCKIEKSGELTKMQLSEYPQCALFRQEIVGRHVHVRYRAPKRKLVAPHPEHQVVLEVPLKPDIDGLQKADVNLHQSLVVAYRMGSKYDGWFSACFGFDTTLVYIGDGRRPVLGTFAPFVERSLSDAIRQSIFGDAEDHWLAFSDCAPYMVATRSSLREVSARFPGGMRMYKFRPNIVVDGEEAWEEDFWTGLCINYRHFIALTKLCNRCRSLDVDYKTGRFVEDEPGTVLNELMKDRRVDKGARWAPVFGRYGFLTSPGSDDAVVAVGDLVYVTGRFSQRPVSDWPLKNPDYARYYGGRDSNTVFWFHLALMLTVGIALLSLRRW